MRVRVISNFVDKYTKTLHKKGEILEMTKERCREINGASYGNLVEEVQDDGAENVLDESTTDASQDSVLGESALTDAVQGNGDSNDLGGALEDEALVEEIQDGGTNDYLDKYTVTEEYLSSMTKKELVELAKEKDINLNMRMTQKEMIEELI